eukprot:scaffold214_cov160-Ochromonas_danica.AAC.11
MSMVVYIPTILEAISAIMNYFSGLSQATSVDNLIDDLENAVRRCTYEGKRLSPLQANDIRVMWTRLIRNNRFDNYQLERLAEIYEDIESLGIRLTAQPERR